MKEATTESMLDHDTEDTYTLQLSRLLRDEHHDNAPLVLELATTGGLNRRVMGYVFGIAVFHADKEVSRRAMDLLRKDADAATLQQAFRLREGATYYYNEAEFFTKYADASFDIFDFLLAAKMCHWHQDAGGHGAYFVMSHQTLNLTHFTDEVLPPSVAALDFVRHLALPAGKTFNLEASFPHLEKIPLETVMMEGNRLEDFPVLLLRLPNLQVLSLKRGNHRPRQPMLVPEGGPYGSATLEKLIVEGYPLCGEERLGPFPQLKEAQLSKSSLTNLSFLEGSLALEILHARQNQIERVPSFMGNMTALRTLDLSDNLFQHIDLPLHKLEQLEELNLNFKIKRSAP
ncbi:MAG: leucine-rich repeat domain-containing protein [Lewinellaceae bacterium]|nr:leucine-rich repeat domain-containing protein [Lewinellaceae bacterium]